MLLFPPLAGEAARFWPAANHHVLWGWKRDEGPLSRAVYFSGQLQLQPSGLALTNPVFFYKHRCARAAAARLAGLLSRARQHEDLVGPVRLAVRPAVDGLAVLRFAFGSPGPEDRDRIHRLQLRRPRLSLGEPAAVADAGRPRLAGLFPVDLYAGSGMSYEAGIPTLCDMHDAFGVDDHEHSGFTFGDRDPLPSRLAVDLTGTLRSFCAVHVAALWADPSPAQQTVAELCRAGAIRQVLSDNVDNLLAKVGVPFRRTRGSGVFNERFAYQPSASTLLVVGVAADRRQIIRQARGRRCRVVVVDPCLRVSPRVQHLNYLRRGDTFHRTTADNFFAAVRERLGIPLPATASSSSRSEAAS